MVDYKLVYTGMYFQLNYETGLLGNPMRRHCRRLITSGKKRSFCTVQAKMFGKTESLVKHRRLLVSHFMSNFYDLTAADCFPVKRSS
jgi:hypothetical protein